MTHIEQILAAVAVITAADKGTIFSRAEIRRQIGVDRKAWESYSATFQAMRVEEPGRAPKIPDRYKKVFEQVERGKHRLTAYGQEVVAGKIDD